MKTIGPFLDSKRVVPVSIFVTLAIGLVFVFVRAPHPWGWFGIDQYHYLAIDIAEGRGFPTLDVPWAYAYVLATFYRVFGPTPLPVLLLQVILNAAIPAIVYAYAREAFERRVAAISALLISVLSFNTIYASTESTDSICTFLFVLMVWMFMRARRKDSALTFTIVGALAGFAAQFRPNLILVPLVLLALNVILGPRTLRRAAQGFVIVAVAVVMLVPWTVRNYRLTGEFLPTSTHGGVQLWYGTLQTGPYLKSRALNPRSVFDAAAFDYTSLLDVPLTVDTRIGCAEQPDRMDLIYRVDNGEPARVNLVSGGDGGYHGSIPAPHHPARLTYFVEAHWPDGTHLFPAGGETDPLVYFVSTDHVGDLDADDRLIDVFDIIRLLRHIAWNEPVRAAGKLDADGNQQLDEHDLRVALRRALQFTGQDAGASDRLQSVSTTPESVTATFTDGSRLSVPREWRGRVTDVEMGLGIASALLSTRERMAAPFPRPRVANDLRCLTPDAVAINQPFYRVQPHEQRRYTALAFDNIGRDPVAYAWSVLYRAFRLFVLEGDSDPRTAHQFSGSAIVYAIGMVASATYFLLFVIGAWLAWRRGYAIWLPLALILYLPATISFVLTNMRYTITVQPPLLVFVGVAVDAALRRVRLIDP